MPPAEHQNHPTNVNNRAIWLKTALNQLMPTEMLSKKDKRTQDLDHVTNVRKRVTWPDSAPNRQEEMIKNNLLKSLFLELQMK